MTEGARRLRRGTLGRIALILGAFAVTLVILEIAVRVIPLYPASFAMPDATLGWRYRPNASGVHFALGCPREFTNTVVLNAEGAHDIDHPAAGPDDRRVLILGDSLVAAMEVPTEALFFRQLDPLLDATAPTEIRAYGTAGYSTAQEWLRYQEFRRAAPAPDAVLVLFTPHNDFMDNHPAFAAMMVDWAYPRPYFRLDEAGALVPVDDVANPVPPLHRALMETSALYRLLSVRIRLLQPPVDLTQPEFVQARAEGWEVTFALLDALRNTVEADGAQFGVLVDQSIVGPGERRAIHEEIAAGLDRLGIRHFSLLDSFDAAADAGTLVRYPCDTHWTPAGHALAAETIAPFVEDLLTAGADREPPA